MIAYYQAWIFIIILFSNIAVAAPDTIVHKFHHPQQFIASLQGDPAAGKKIYMKFCATCHAAQPLISLGAPRIGVATDWQARMTRNLDEMLAKIDPGFNAMPPRGGCFECSDAELKAAISYMLPKTKPYK